MTAELRDALTASRGDGALPESSSEEELQSLLRALLARLRRARATPLQFGIDSEGIADAALKDFFAGAGGGDSRPWHDWQLGTAVLDKLVAQFIQPEVSSRRDEAVIQSELQVPNSEVEGSTVKPAAPVQGRGIRATDAATPHPLAVWLERFHTVMTGVQPRAIDIVTLRVEGFQDRDIAERLELGLRLVKRIVQDMRADWGRVTGKE